MKTVFGAGDFGPALSNCVLTIGNFDGVHLGHQELIRRLLKKATEKRVPSVVFTFDPHPMTVLRPEKPFMKLFALSDQQDQLARAGVDYFVVEKFSKDFSFLSPENFLETYLFRPFNPSHIVVGYDFAFGSGKGGTIDQLREFAGRRSCEVEVVSPVAFGDEVISSSLIRSKVVAGDIALANQLLQRPFYIEGIVEKGDQRGRTLGFPTANLAVTNEVRPKSGVYVTRTKVGDEIFNSVSNLGVRPTFKSADLDFCFLETHIFNFNRSIYGERIQVELLDFLRPEKKFSGVDSLKEQIAIDCQRAQEVHDELAGGWRRVR